MVKLDKRLLLCACVIAVPATAQSASGSSTPQATVEAGPSRGLDEIVVTARRRSESLIDVPVAVSALSAQALDRAHVSDLTQIAQMTPNLLIGSAAGGGAIALRGVGTSAPDPGIEQSVGVNIDGVSIGRGKIITASQFDLQQVEVLKGPQALFFGKNSPAGVISITSADPTKTFSALARAGYEIEANERYLEGYVSGPITENLLFRVAGRYSNMDGWIKNVTVPAPNLAAPGYTVPGPGSKESPSTEAYSGRLSLKWTPTTNFTAALKFTASHLDTDDDGNAEVYCRGPELAAGKQSVLALGIGQYVFDPQTDCKLNQRKSEGAVPEAFQTNWPEAQRRDGKFYYVMNSYLGSLSLNFNVGDVNISSTTGYTKLDSRGLIASEHTAFAVVVSAPGEDARTWSQEFRVTSDYSGPLNFTLGAYYEDAHRDNTYKPSLGFIGFDAANGGSIYTFSDIWRTSGATYSAFGQLRWKIIDQVELSGGTRYTTETKRSAGQNLYLNGLGGAFGLAPVGEVVSQKNKFSNWSPEVTLTYKPTTGIMAYVAYKTGYKSGGLSNPATISSTYVADPSLLAFKPERSKGFEGGIKGELFDRTVRFDLSVYRYTFSDLQLTSFNPTLVAYFIRNAGKARTSGIEGSLSWRATPELSFNTSASYNRAKYVDFQNAQCYAELYFTPTCPGGASGSYDRSGQTLPRAPKYTFNASADYTKEIGAGLIIGLGGDAIYSSSFQTSETGAPAGVIDGFWRFNANLRVSPKNERWELALIGRNLSNRYYFLVSSDNVLSGIGDYTAYTVRPREIALQATVKF